MLLKLFFFLIHIWFQFWWACQRKLKIQIHAYIRMYLYLGARNNVNQTMIINFIKPLIDLQSLVSRKKMKEKQQLEMIGFIFNVFKKKNEFFSLVRLSGQMHIFAWSISLFTCSDYSVSSGTNMHSADAHPESTGQFSEHEHISARAYADTPMVFDTDSISRNPSKCTTVCALLCTAFYMDSLQRVSFHDRASVCVRACVCIWVNEIFICAYQPPSR